MSGSVMDGMTPIDLLERSLWDVFWVPPDVTVVDRPELLALRCPRPVSFLNSVLRSGDCAAGLPALVAEVAALHSHCVSRWIVTDTVDRTSLVAALRDGGYTPTVHHEARIMRVDAFRAGAGGEFSVRRVDSMDSLRQQTWVMNMAFGKAVPATEEIFGQGFAVLHRARGSDTSVRGLRVWRIWRGADFLRRHDCVPRAGFWLALGRRNDRRGARKRGVSGDIGRACGACAQARHSVCGALRSIRYIGTHRRAAGIRALGRDDVLGRAAAGICGVR